MHFRLQSSKQSAAMKTKRSTETKKSKNPTTTPKTIIKATKNEESKPTDLERGLNEISQEEDDGREERYEQEQNAREEDQLKTGKYSLLKHSSNLKSPEIRLSEVGQKAYDENLEKRDTEDLAFWRVARTLR